MSNKEIENKEVNALSNEDLDQVSGGIICPPKKGTKHCQYNPYNRGSLYKCSNPDWKYVGKEYVASDGVKYQNWICLNCGAQWATYFASDGHWYSTPHYTF